ncbi:hypothetical protein C0971_10030 [Bacillus methanolicus]|uniref:hypothetical protein n=1 Tax=Bacillus methanolicus TaxID=1471 RepID=UPI002010A5B5|nr:hypothetical protein [Bacillus methanolicus]UQD52310.1 hypothetical protein C0971_10030 [Bacillus methanolicus]
MRKAGIMIKDTDNMRTLTKNLNKLNKKRIKVGVFGDDNYKYGDDANIVTIARVHEFGATIRPVKAEWLTIPLIPEAKGKRAADFGKELFFYQKDDNKAFLARKRGKDVENVFLLLKSVTIPERSFLRSGYDENIDHINKKIDSMIEDVLTGGIDPDVFADMIGQEFAGLIQKKLRSISDPPNSPITINVKGSSNPLIDTGHLVGSIRHEVE